MSQETYTLSHFSSEPHTGSSDDAATNSDACRLRKLVGLVPNLGWYKANLFSRRFFTRIQQSGDDRVIHEAYLP